MGDILFVTPVVRRRRASSSLSTVRNFKKLLCKQVSRVILTIIVGAISIHGGFTYKSVHCVAAVLYQAFTLHILGFDSPGTGLTRD